MSASRTIVTVTLNPAIGRIFEVDDVVPGRHLRGRRIDAFPGGKGITVSRVLAQLGTASIATGFVGEQEFRWFEETLTNTGPGRITCQLLRVTAPTRDNIIILDLKNENATYIRDRGHHVTQADLDRIQAKVSMLAREETILFFGGTLPPKTPKGWFRNLVARSIEAGAQVAVTGDGEVIEAVHDLPLWMLRMNRKAASALLGRSVTDRQTAAQAAHQIVQGGVATALVTVGSHGAALATESGCWTGHTKTSREQFVNKVGCGDSLMAGLFHEWLRSGDWVKSFEEALAVAAANTMTPCAGLILPDEVEDTRSQTTVESASVVSV